MKQTPKILALLLIFSVGTVLISTCANPMSGDSGGDATITIDLGSGNVPGKGVIKSVSIANLKHTLTFSGPTGKQTRTITGGGSVKVTVVAGTWYIDVEAYLGEALYAMGSATAEVKAGQNTNVLVQMNVVWSDSAGTSRGGSSSVGNPDYTININKIGDTGADSITASPATGQAGQTVTINYTVDNSAFYNLLDFSGVTAAIPGATSAGSGSVTYTIDQADASNGVITIIATFNHTNLAVYPIIFATPGLMSKTYGDPAFSNSVTSSHPNIATLTYTSSLPAVADVDGSGQVTIHSAGSTIITADIAGDAVNAAASASYTVNVSKKQLGIASATHSKTYDGTTTASGATATLSGVVGGDTVSLATSYTAAYQIPDVGANLNFTGLALTGTDAGNYYIATAIINVVATPGIAKASGATLSTPTVSSITTNSITVNPLTASTGQTVLYAVSVSGTETITSLSSVWQTSDTFSGLSGGPFYVYAYAQGGSNYNDGPISVSSSSFTLTATTYIITINNIDPNGTATSSVSSATEGSTITLTATPDPGYGVDDFSTWASSPSVTITGVTSTTATFVMPASAITITPSFAPAYTVTFNTDGGSPGNYTSQTVLSGGLASDPSSPTPPTKTWTLPIGLYTGTPALSGSYTFNGWLEGGLPFDIGSDPITGNITLTADWTNGPATRIPSVTGVSTTLMTNTTTHVNANSGTFTLVLDGGSISLGPQTMNNSGANLTIVGTSTTTISLSSNGHLLRVDAGTLTLDNNITLVGKSANNQPLVVITGGSTFVMKDGSKITGNEFLFNASGFYEGAGVRTINGGTFNMEGGEISGNSIVTYTGGNDGWGVGAVMVSQNSTFNMTGGVIKDNHVSDCYWAAGGVAIQYYGNFSKTGGIIYGGGAGGGLANTATGSNDPTLMGQAVFWDNGNLKVNGDKFEGDIVSTSPVMGFDP